LRGWLVSDFCVLIEEKKQVRDSDIRITPSIVDRLLDFDPTNSQEAPKSRSQGLRELKVAVRRDLEWLLNTRHSPDGITESLEEVYKSVAKFGLPDFTGLSSQNDDERRDLIRSIEKALEIFEPRFMNVRISLEDVDSAERGVKFRIQATLRVEPTPEPVVFDTILQVGSGDFEVKEV
jgi:type VI secretion system protein ImpF